MNYRSSRIWLNGFPDRKKSLPYSTSGRLLSPNDLGPADFGKLVQGFWSILWKLYTTTGKRATTKMFVFCLDWITIMTKKQTNELHNAESFLSYQSLNKDIFHPLRDPRIQYCIHKKLLLVPTLSQADPLHSPTYSFNIIFSSSEKILFWKDQKNCNHHCKFSQHCVQYVELPSLIQYFCYLFWTASVV
jgi:hypothetical protein